jgi:hypothetical protein
VGLVNGGGSARGSDEASAPPAPAENPRHELNGHVLNADTWQDREGLRRLRERDAQARDLVIFKLLKISWSALN